MSLPLLLFLILLGISKVVLLVNPLTYHALNHELFALRCFLGVAVYFVIDVLLYLVLGNVHYCHPDTLTGLVRFYEFDLKIKLEDFAYVSIYHILIDTFCVVVLLVLELIALVLAWKTDRKIAAAGGAPRRPIISATNMPPPSNPGSSSRPVGITSDINKESGNQRVMQANKEIPIVQNSKKQDQTDTLLSYESDNEVLLGAGESIVEEQVERHLSGITHQLPPVPGQANPSVILVVRSLENHFLQQPVDQLQQPCSDQLQQQSSDQLQQPSSDQVQQPSSDQVEPMASSLGQQPDSNQLARREDPPVITQPQKRFKLVSFHSTLITFLYTITLIGILTIQNCLFRTRTNSQLYSNG